MLRPPRPPPLPTVSVCKGRGTSRGGEGAPPPLWGRRCGRSRRGCCRCQVASEEEAVAAAANMFSVRIVTADYYMASPLQGLDICQSPLTQAPVKKVPVVRVFGATPAGKRAQGARGREPAGLPSSPRTRAHAAGPLGESLPRLPPFSPSLPARDEEQKCGSWLALRPAGGVAAGAVCLHCGRRRKAGPALPGRGRGGGG